MSPSKLNMLDAKDIRNSMRLPPQKKTKVIQIVRHSVLLHRKDLGSFTLNVFDHFKLLRIVLAVLLLLLCYRTCAAGLVPTAIAQIRSKTPLAKSNQKRIQNIRKSEHGLPRARGRALFALSGQGVWRLALAIGWERTTALTVAAAISQRQRQQANTSGNYRHRKTNRKTKPKTRKEKDK